MMLHALVQGICYKSFVFVNLIYQTCATGDFKTLRDGRRNVLLPEGPLKGVEVEFDRDTLHPVEVFRGIHYHTTRGNLLRFFPPRPPITSWNVLQHKDVFSLPCSQVRKNGSKVIAFPDQVGEYTEKLSQFSEQSQEDCLSLNVYVPSQDKNDTTPFPVMVFVHGESYDMGTGNAYDGSVLASFGRVIVVTVNYRLGVLGFLSTGDRDANGNQALLDLLAVLTWIKENIASFDGDPNSVTLFGHGHGAALVNFLMLNRVIQFSPKGNNLFHRAILQSGSAYSTWATSVDPITCAHLLAVNVNCSDRASKSNAFIQCLKNRTAEHLVQNAPIPPKYFSCFAPTLENPAFFPFNSIDRLIERRSGSFTNIDVMFGVTRNEAYSYLNQSELENGISYSRKSQILKTYVQNVYKYHRQKIFEILDHQYSEWDRMQDYKSRRDNIMELISDGQYVAPLVKMAREHSKYADTYFYSFGYSTQSQSEGFPKWSSGVHGEELPYIFGAPLVDGVSPFSSKYKNYEKELSAFMMRMWTNFAKSGNPNYPMKTSDFEGTRYSDITWPKYEEGNQLYLQIGRRTLTRDHYRGKQMALWLDLLPKINVEDSKHMTKPDSAEHNLFDPKNMSTFDEPSRLMNHFPHIGPPLMRIPFILPVLKDENKLPSDIGARENKSTTARSAGQYINITESEDAMNTVSPVSGSFNMNSIAKSSVPLSITVAVGCTLLFFNILIFAGVYYQRQRIKTLKESQTRGIQEELYKADKKDDINEEANEHETRTLLCSGENNQNSLTSSTIRKTVEENRDMNCASITMKPKNDLSDKASYSPIPTNSSSSLHKTHNHIDSNNLQTSTYMGRSHGERQQDLSASRERTLNKNIKSKRENSPAMTIV